MEAKSKTVRVDEEAATVKANEAQALKNECESDLAEAIPALEAALSALDTLKVSFLSLNAYQVLYVVLKTSNTCECRVTQQVKFLLFLAFRYHYCEVNE